MAFGNSIILSLSILFGAEVSQNYFTLTHNKIMLIVVSEIIMFLLIGWFLKVRGWVYEDFNLNISWRLTGVGLILATVSIGITYIVYVALSYFGLNIDMDILQYSASEWSIYSASMLSIINPIYEETIVVGYLMGVFMKPNDPGMSLNISVGVRLLYHLYQGPGGVITIIPMGLLFSYYYTKKRKLWPLIFAHSVMDFSWFAVNHYFGGV